MNLKYRPFAVIGFTVLSVLMTCVFLTDKAAVISAASGLMLFIMSFSIKKIREKVFPFYIAGALIFSGVLFTAVNENDLKYAESFIGDTVEVDGVITEEPSFSNSRYYYVLNLNRIDGNKVNAKMRLSLPNAIPAEPYDSVKLKATLYEIASESQDIQLYYRSKGIFLGGYAYNSEDFDIQVTKRTKDTLSYKIYLIREEITARVLDKLPNENGATVIAMLLGDKTILPDELNEKFREVGIAPIFAVSGLHLSVWVMGLYGLLSQLGVKKRLNSFIGIVFTLFFMILTALSPSVCRSGLMMILVLSGNIFYRKSDSLNSLGFAAFVLCSVNPYIAADSGFLMSFSATLGIVLLIPLANKYIFSNLPVNAFGKALKSFATAMAVSISASIGVFPVTVFFIGYFSIFTVLSNLLVTYAATVCMVLGGLTAITYKLSFLADIISLFAGLLTKYLIGIVELICKIPTTTISTDNIFWKIGVIGSIVILIFSLLCFKGKKLLKSICIGMSAMIIVCSVTAYFYYDGLTQIRILDVGNGVSTVISNEGNKLVLSGEADGYYKSGLITDSLNQISRADADMMIIADINGAEDSANLDIIKTIDFKKIILPVSGKSIETIYDSKKIIAAPKASIETWSGGQIRYYCHDDFSLAHCTFNNTTVLMLFDSKKKADIPEEYLSADFLICSGYIPNCISPEAYEKVFICGEEEIAMPICEYVRSCAGVPICVTEYNDIRINIREDSHKIFAMEG